ncbi:MAG: iron-sulfur cluster assembly accessory protein [Bacteriovoracaceae bacterium]|nr:iron-sulfur cluster assembly accessory protein [Bacteriovoracaceae bacterium]
MSTVLEKNEVDIAIDSIILISRKAVDQMIKIQQDEFQKNSQNQSVRVAVIGGGCSGLSYKISFDAPKIKDHIISLAAGVDLLVDPKSGIYLKGTLLDFEDGLDGKGFVFKNPNAKNTCGCGESFSF